MVGSIVGIVNSIINTRFLEPSAYGDVRYVDNIIGFVASLLLFGYFLSGSRLLALSRNEEQSRRIRGCLVVILILAIFVLTLSTAICILIHKQQDSISFLFVVSLPVCATPLLINYINNTAQGDNHIGKLVVTRIIPPVLYAVAAYIIYTNFGATPARMILLSGGVSVAICTIVILAGKPSFHNLKPVFKELNKENKLYGFQLYIGSIVMVTTGYIAGMTLSIFNEDNTQVGFYTLAISVTAPLTMIPSIIGTTYFKKFATLPRIPDKLMKSTIILTTISCIFFVLLIQQLIVWLFTEKYAPVGLYAVYLAAGSCIHGLGDMINRYMGSHGQGKSIRNSSIINGLFKIMGYSLLVYLWNINGALITTLLCDIIYAGCMFLYYNKFVKINAKA
ncbi:MAG: oligosaccharide flippase family protein [Bacteroidales bacterium]|nr:oligosaccharide flippase family protein [Bacteroidales bacterium]